MEALTDVGYTWQQWGGIWGGSVKDPIHFEYPGFESVLASQPPPDDPFLVPAEKLADPANPWFIKLLTPWQVQLYASLPEWARNLLIVPRPIEEIRYFLDLYDKYQRER